MKSYQIDYEDTTWELKDEINNYVVLTNTGETTALTTSSYKVTFGEDEKFTFLKTKVYEAGYDGTYSNSTGYSMNFGPYTGYAGKVISTETFTGKWEQTKEGAVFITLTALTIVENNNTGVSAYTVDTPAVTTITVAVTSDADLISVEYLGKDDDKDKKLYFSSYESLNFDGILTLQDSDD
jgi:hypothetical protein